MYDMIQDDFKTLFRSDLKRHGNTGIVAYVYIWHFLFRKAQTRRNAFSRKIWKSLYWLHSRRRGIEIPPRCRLGKGLYVGHFYNVTINGDAVLGENCNIHKGVTIGVECRGPRQGTPVIGNRVSICVNATIVGKITVGDDVIIGPNAFVNRSIPSHSVVFGNPCIIKHRDYATEGYVCNLV